MRRLAIGLSLASLAAGPALPDTGAAPDTRSWICRFCTEAAGWYGSWQVGAGLLSDADEPFANYRGLEGDGGFASVFADVVYRGDRGRWFEMDGRDLGADSARLDVRGGVRGRYRWFFEGGSTPRYRGNGETTPFRGEGTTRLELPAGWETAADTVSMSGLGAALRPAGLRTDRDRVAAGVAVRLPRNWSLDVSFRHDRKDGSRPLGSGVFTLNSSLYPAPVDFRSNRFSVAANYQSETGGLRIAWDSDHFNNRAPFVTLDNPFTPVGETGVLRTGLEPDNESQRLTIAGSYRPNQRWRMNLQAGVGHSSGDDTLLPYSINPDFDSLELPRTSLGGRVDLQSLNLSGRITARVTGRTQFNLRFKSDDRDNRTPVDLWRPVITDLVERPGTPNRPYSFERTKIDADLSWRSGTQRLSGGAGREARTRSLQSVRETRDHRLWGEWGFDTGEWAQFRLRLESSDRDITPYLPVSDPGLIENPLMRKFNLAGRDRRRASLDIDLAPGKRWSSSLSLQRSEDRYQASQLGLMDSDEQAWNLDLGYHADGGLSLNAFAALESLDSGIAGAEFNGAAPWRAVTRDRFHTVSIGADGAVGETWRWRLDVVQSRSRGRIAIDRGDGARAFPDLHTRLRNIRLSLTRQLPGPWGWSLSAEHERFETRDWQSDGLGIDGVNNILLLGPLPADTRALLLRLHADYRFR